MPSYSVPSSVNTKLALHNIKEVWLAMPSYSVPSSVNTKLALHNIYRGLTSYAIIFCSIKCKYEVSIAQHLKRFD